MSEPENSQENPPTPASDSDNLSITESSSGNSSIPVSDSDNSSVPVSNSDISSIPVSDSGTSSVPMSDSSIDMSTPSEETLSLGDLTELSEEESPLWKRVRYSDIAGVAEPVQSRHPIFSFRCSLNCSRYLKLAIESLSDPEINSNASGRIDVDGNGFAITVQNSITYAVSRVCLNPAGFWCDEPIRGMKANFDELSQVLAHVDDEAVLVIARCKVTDKLKFLMPGDVLTLDLVENDAEIRMFPEMSAFCEGTVSSDDLKLLAQRLLQQNSHQVSVEITGNTATLKVESEDSWEANYAMQQVNGSGEVEAGEKYRECFQWARADLLQRVSQLYSDAGFLVRFHTNRPKCIVLRFHLPDQGCLEFMREVKNQRPISETVFVDQ